MKTSSCSPIAPILLTALALGAAARVEAEDRPNILFLFSDDHAVKSISAYGGPLAEVAPTPNIDRLAREGAVFLNSFCANSICGPSRATILTGKAQSQERVHEEHGHRVSTRASGRFPRHSRQGGYTTAVIGKWAPQDHARSDSTTGRSSPDRGSYYNPDCSSRWTARRSAFEGYATDLTTDKALEPGCDARDKSKPFLLMCQHKAPHRTFAPALRHLGAFDECRDPRTRQPLRRLFANRSRTLAQERNGDRSSLRLGLRRESPQGRARAMSSFRSPDRYGTPEYNRMTDAEEGMGCPLWAAQPGSSSRLQGGQAQR